MKRCMKWTALAFTLLASATPALAQTPAKPNAQKFPVGTAPKVKVGQTYSAQTFDSWEILCVKAAKGPEPCEVGQLVLDDKASPIADIRIFPLQPGSKAIAGATMVIPLGVQLSDGLLFGVDKKKTKQYPYAFCSGVGCVSRIGLTAIELQAMRTGKLGNLQFTMANNSQKPILLSFSLKGFAPAYTALRHSLIAAQKAARAAAAKKLTVPAPIKKKKK